MKKKGQFYFLAMIVIVSIVIGIVTITNTIKSPINPKLIYEQNEIETERAELFDYFANEQIVETETNTILSNFAAAYVSKMGSDKDIIFILEKDGNLRLRGNKLDDTNLLVYAGAGSTEINSGEVDISLTLLGNEVSLEVDSTNHTFTMEEGQNLFYFVRYKYDDELYIIKG